MPAANTLRIALKAIRRNKVRSGLTMLGVIIGVASLVALTSVASGATGGINNALSGLMSGVAFFNMASALGRPRYPQWKPLSFTAVASSITSNSSSPISHRPGASTLRCSRC